MMFYFLSIKFKENEGNLGSTKPMISWWREFLNHPQAQPYTPSEGKDGREDQAILVNTLNPTF